MSLAPPLKSDGKAPLRLFALSFASLQLAFAMCQVCAAAETIQIKLKPNAELTQEVAHVSDIAEIAGGDLISRRQISKLDVATLLPSETKLLSDRELELRVLLAGIPAEKFRMTGANAVQLTRSEVVSLEERIVEAFRSDVAARLGLPESEFDLRLQGALPKNVVGGFTGSVEIQQQLKSRVRIGNFTATCRLLEPNKRTLTLNVPLQVRVYRDVFVASQALSAGQMVSSEGAKKERRLVDDRALRLLAKSVEGKPLRKDVEANEILTRQHFGPVARPKREIAIRSRDIVEIVAVGKGLQARVSGAVALQQGAIGDAIRVKNPNSTSNAVLTAEVVSPGVVRIRL